MIYPIATTDVPEPFAPKVPKLTSTGGIKKYVEHCHILHSRVQ